MVSLETPVCDFGAPAVDFSLQGVDGQIWTLEKCRGEKGLLVMGPDCGTAIINGKPLAFANRVRRGSIEIGRASCRERV